MKDLEAKDKKEKIKKSFYNKLVEEMEHDAINQDEYDRNYWVISMFENSILLHYKLPQICKMKHRSEFQKSIPLSFEVEDNITSHKNTRMQDHLLGQASPTMYTFLPLRAWTGRELGSPLLMPALMAL